MVLSLPIADPRTPVPSKQQLVALGLFGRFPRAVRRPPLAGWIDNQAAAFGNCVLFKIVNRG